MLTDNIFSFKIRSWYFMTRTAGWIPVLLPKDVVKKLLKEAVVTSGTKKLEPKQVLLKLHKTRKKLLKANPDAYIDYTA